MTWFLIALSAPFLWALVNIFDKYLVDKFSQREKEKVSGGLVLFPSIMAVIIALFILFFTANVFNLPVFNKLLLMFSGILTIIWIIIYLYILETEDVSMVAPLFLLIPVFGFIFGFIFLGETLKFQQIIGSLVIFIGVLLISLDFSGENKKFKWKPVIFMTIVCLLVATSGIIFKYVTVENNFWVSSFWEYAGIGLAGLIIFIFVPKYRDHFMHINRTSGRQIFLINIASELMTVSGNLLTNFALLLAPVTMVYLVGSFQPAFVLFLGLLATKFFPHIGKENLIKHVLLPKIIAIIVMIIGSVILFI